MHGSTWKYSAIDEFFLVTLNLNEQAQFSMSIQSPMGLQFTAYQQHLVKKNDA